jgi:hypothetical protein
VCPVCPGVPLVCPGTPVCVCAPLYRGHTTTTHRISTSNSGLAGDTPEREIATIDNDEIRGWLLAAAAGATHEDDRHMAAAALAELYSRGAAIERVRQLAVEYVTDPSRALIPADALADRIVLALDTR